MKITGRHRDQDLNIRTRIRNRAVLSAVFAIVSTTPGHAELTSGVLTGGEALANGGTFQIIGAPATLPNNAYDDDNVRAFDEVQDLALTDTLIMDLAASNLSSNVLGAGSVVSSHYVIFDPAVLTTVEGTVTFNEPVLGVIISNERFNDTDSLLGNPATTYSIGSQELESPDTVSINGNTVEFSLQTSSPGDAIRVVTGTNPLPGINICDGGSTTLSAVITGGSSLDNGGQFRQICDPVGPVGDDNFDSFDLFAFEEQQAVELVEDLAIDAQNVIAAGEVVSSFYVVYDPVPTNRVIASITFPDDIIAVIRDRDELIASEFLGNASAQYLNPSLLGLEGGDVATINGNQLDINFSAGSPGDSIRVILGSASPSLNVNICPAQQTTLTGAVTGGTAATAGGTFLQLCDPIGPVGNNNFQANDLFAFEESLGVMLTAPLDLDIPAITLPTGTIVSTYYVAFDPASTKDIIGTVNFDGIILGVATELAALTASDDLGNPTAVYLNPGLRGLESDDFASFAGNTLSVDFSANSPGDYIRVFMAGAPDTDDDGIDDIADNCILADNADQRDTNGDGFGNLCDADLNDDCSINFFDLQIFQSVFFGSDPDADLDGNGVVNFLDLQLVQQSFFGTPGPSGLPNGCDP